MAKKELDESSASSGALFKEELPRKMIFQELWMNKHELPPQKGRQLEAAEEGTLMGRLAARMSARDMIDELDLGPKGRSPSAKKAQVAEADIPHKMRIEGVADKDLRIGETIEHEHDETVKKIIEGKVGLKNAPKMIRNDHLKEHPKYYDSKKGLPAMEKKLEKADLFNEVPSKLMIGPGLHSQMQNIGPDTLQTTKSRKGINMAEQAKNAGNVFNTMHKNKR